MIKRLFNPLKALGDSGKLSGILLIAATVLSMLLSNSEFGASYLELWKHEIGFSFLHHTILHWINDGLMVIFFLLVGIEIKRELLVGELSNIRQALLPVMAAIGGMGLPALIFLVFNAGKPENLPGWAIPSATDIAFSLGILTLLGKRVPVALKVFLVALAIIDDLGAIVIIAFFYTSELHLNQLVFAALFLVGILVMNRLRIKYIMLYILPGIGLWYFVMKSGIHPTIAGVLLAFLIPRNLIAELEHSLHKPVHYLILPLFALANTAIPLSLDGTGMLVSSLTLGILAGLVIGKPLGILTMVFLGVKLGITNLPERINWRQMAGTGMLAGIGFTMSIFIASLSFPDETLLNIAKLSVILGSLISAIAGIIMLKYFSENPK